MVIRTKLRGNVIHLFSKSLQPWIVLIFLSDRPGLICQLRCLTELSELCLIAFDTVYKLLHVGLTGFRRSLAWLESDIAAFGEIIKKCGGSVVQF